MHGIWRPPLYRFERPLTGFGFLSIVIAVTVDTVSRPELPVDAFQETLVPALGLAFAAIGLGLGGMALFRVPFRDVVTVAVELVVKNSLLGLVVARTSLDFEATLPIMAFAAAQTPAVTETKPAEPAAQPVVAKDAPAPDKAEGKTDESKPAMAAPAAADVKPTPAEPKGASWRSKARKLDARDVQRALENVATRLERIIALTTWEDPVVTGAFVAGCLVAALFLASHSFQVVLLCVGLYATRPPSWRVVPGPLESLLGRMPDKGEAYARLMQETGVGGKGAASGA